MTCYRQTAYALLLLVAPCMALSADWSQFRGPTGQGISDEKGVPVRWSSQDSIVWKLKLPGAGASSPIILGKRVYLTCYSGYGLDTKEPGKQEDLRRHLLCLDRADGKILWSKVFEPVLPEHKYSGEGAYQGYAGSTPITRNSMCFSASPAFSVSIWRASNSGMPWLEMESAAGVRAPLPCCTRIC